MRRTNKIIRTFLSIALVLVCAALVSFMNQPIAQEPQPTTIEVDTGQPIFVPTNHKSKAAAVMPATVAVTQPMETPLETDYYKPEPEVTKVVAWGQMATNKDGSATLVAKQAVAGPIPDTQQVTFDLCAVKEINLPDTGMVDILSLMGNEVTDTSPNPTPPSEDYHNPHYPVGDILIDNTNTIVHGVTDGAFSRYLPAGVCANVTVVSPNYDMETAFLGFTSYDTSVHLEGEFTRIMPGGMETILAHEP